MVYTYLKIALRNIFKKKFYSVINILGLGIGLASFLIIYLYISDELSYDRHHREYKNIYRLVNVYDFEGVGENSASSPFPVAFTMMKEYPGMIRNAVRIFNFQAPRSFIKNGEHGYNERRFFFADSTFFSIFDHRFIRGNPETALDEQFSVVITESTARKYFRGEDPIGRTLNFEDRFDLRVTAVIEDVPTQSHFHFDFMASLSSVRAFYGGRLPRTWVWNPCWTYFLLEPGVDPADLEASFPKFIQKYFYDAEKDNISLYLQPLKDIHLKSRLDYEIEPNNSLASIYILSGIAVFLLLISIINFVNMATAVSAGRAREIGIKKVTGAYRIQLVLQYMGEALILSFISVVAALIIVEFSLPLFNDFTAKDFTIADLFEWNNLLLIVMLWILTGLLSGFYPAIFLSSLKPVNVISDVKRVGIKSGLPRRILVILQFSISIFLIIGTLVIHSQLRYLRSAELGFEPENVVIVPILNTSVARVYPAFKKELEQHSVIKSVTAMDDIFGVGHNTHEFRPEGFPEDQWQFYPALVVTYDFLETFGIDLLAGRDYREENKTDPSKGILVNEAMVRHMGWESNEAALGKKFRSLSGDERIIGVFEDFHATSLHKSAGPFVLNIKERPGEVMFFLKYMAVKVQQDAIGDAVSLIEEKWEDFTPGRPFEYFMLQDELRALYSDEENLSRLSLIFTVVVIILSLMGLLGLVSFMSQQKTREIGIRLVLGASRMNIVVNLSSEFIWLIIIASLLAWAFAYIIIIGWLSYFAYSVTVSWLYFGLATLIALMLAMMITGFRAYIASRADPVETLKYE